MSRLAAGQNKDGGDDGWEKDRELEVDEGVDRFRVWGEEKDEAWKLADWSHCSRRKEETRSARAAWERALICTWAKEKGHQHFSPLSK
jgi:hypothetical protein